MVYHLGSRVNPKHSTLNHEPKTLTPWIAFYVLPLDTCTSAVTNQECFRTSVSIGIQQAQSEGENPRIQVVSSECVIWYTCGAHVRNKPKLRVRKTQHRGLRWRNSVSELEHERLFAN